MKRQVLFLSLLCFSADIFGLTRHVEEEKDEWPYRLVANYTGDIILGALFPIHEQSANFSGCGRIQKEDGIQPLEAMLYTVRKINNDGLLPGFKLGVIALDSCDNVIHALEQSLDFIKGFIAKLNEHHEQQFMCHDGLPPKYRGGEFDRIVGVVGAQSSAVSLQVANLLRLFKVPQISYLSTSTTLSKTEAFEYFFRTVPSDINQAHCIMAILGAFNWTYVSLVYASTEYGNNGFEELQRLAPKYNVCFAFPQRIHVDQASNDDYDDVIRNLKVKTNVRVVVVFTDKRTAHNLMSAAKRLNVVGRFVWIGTDGWSGRASVTHDVEEVIEGAITVQPMAGIINGFDEYFTSLTATNNTINPWFGEFYEEYFQCKLESVKVNPFNDLYPPCGPEIYKVSGDNGYHQQWYLHFIRDAVYAFAYALKNMHTNFCKGKRGLCRALEERIEKHDLKLYLQNVTFKDERGISFRFFQRDALPRYSIYNYQRMGDDSFQWIVVGNYSLSVDGQPQLEINSTALKFVELEPQFPASFCSKPCIPGQAKMQQDGDHCCWICTNCSTYQYLQDDFHCQDCPLGTLPSLNKTRCTPIPVSHLDYKNPWSIGTISIAGIGVIFTAAVGFIFWTYADTPIIKAAGRELNYILLLGTFLSFLTPFFIVAKPSPMTCGVARFLIGFCYTLCYAAIVTKTNRIARIFNPHNPNPHKARYISPKSQLVITGLLTSLEIGINAVWLFHRPPTVISIHPTPEDNIAICAGADDASYLVGLVYPLILVGICTVFAFKTRKCPDGFNEARFIAFTNYTTCIVWLAFVPVFFASSSTIQRSLTISLALSLSGFVLLGCLFVPKLYIVLLKPEKNTKEGVMSQCRTTFVPSSSIKQPPLGKEFLNGSFKSDAPQVKNTHSFKRSHSHSTINDHDEKNFLDILSSDDVKVAPKEIVTNVSTDDILIQNTQSHTM
uniref:G-protein coupled receptors family 3 profile domain-containing protein n=1 Tax=Strigamia maritima TaxID=126957 RepID=T1IJD5_STRMM